MRYCVVLVVKLEYNFNYCYFKITSLGKISPDRTVKIQGQTGNSVLSDLDPHCPLMVQEVGLILFVFL